MRVYYDKEHDACAVGFDKNDTVIFDVDDKEIHISSCNGGKPEMIERKLLFEIEELEEK